VPRTRDRFVHNPLVQLLNPSITQAEENKRRYHHDKLNIRDISGTVSDTYGKLKKYEGRDLLEVADIDKATPAKMKQHRITNIPDYKLITEDVNGPKKQPKRITNPLDPVYRMETQSRRHIMELGKIDGSYSNPSKSP
jgi:hypothetical protein